MSRARKESNRGSSEAHSRLLKDVLLALGSSPLCRVWRNECGMALNLSSGRPFKYGLEGSPDIIGFTCSGLFIGIEIKTGESDLSKQQKIFHAVAKKFQVNICVARSVSDAVSFVQGVAGDCNPTSAF